MPSGSRLGVGLRGGHTFCPQPLARSLASCLALSLCATNLMGWNQSGASSAGLCPLGSGARPRPPPSRSASRAPPEAVLNLPCKTGPLAQLTGPGPALFPCPHTALCMWLPELTVCFSPKGTRQRPPALCNCHQGFSGPLPACAHLGGPARLGKPKRVLFSPGQTFPLPALGFPRRG